MDRIHFSKVKFDAKVYPRDKWSTATIERYTDSMAGGDAFPPIVLEDGTDRLLDGVHRWKATERLAERGNGFDGKLAFERHTVPEGIPIKLYAASLSVRHGDSITRADRKTLAREIVEDNPEFNTVTLAKMLAVSDETARSYVGDILARRRDDRSSKAGRLGLLGWTQREIAKVLGVSQQTVADDLPKIQDLGKSVISLFGDGHDIGEIVMRTGLSQTHATAMILQGKDDADRMSHIGIKTQPYDVWQFPRCHDLMGDPHPGRIPGEIVCHVLYFFTKPGDVIIDPMAGSGTTADACLLMGRKCFAYDLDDRHERIDIIPHDIAQDGWPDKIAKANLIFWDPPYFKKMDSSNVKDGYIDGSISKMPRSDYLAFFREVLTEAKGKVKKGTKLAFLMSDYDDAKGESIFIWDYANVIDGAGWDLVRHIQAPLSTQQVHPDIVGRFRESRRLARLERYLLIAEAK